MSTIAGPQHLCPQCGRPRSYSYANGALFCEHCDAWLELACVKPNCIFCGDRRAKPSEHGLCKPVTKTNL